MQGKKVVYLFLALLLPVGIFIFLRTFGKNEFDVPAFYQDVAPKVSAECTGDYKAPYHLPDSIIGRLPNEKSASLYVIYFSDEIQARIKQEVEYDEVEFVNAKILEGTNQVRKCVLIVPGAEDLVVID